MILEVQDGCYTYPKATEPVLKHINFRLEENKVMTILGRNGIGKTTLLKCMSGIFQWDSGRTFVNGKEYQSTRDIKNMAFVPQAHPLSYPYSVEDIVTMGRVRYMGALSVPSKKDKALAQDALSAVGMQDYAKRACTQLSGGQLQMVFIARALAAQPEMLVMDEPESHLDFGNQYIVLELVERLKEERKISCIINTHYPDHALQISDYCLMLGRDSYLFGSGEEVITSENIAEYFGVDTEISTILRRGKHFKTFVVFGTVNEDKEKEESGVKQAEALLAKKEAEGPSTESPAADDPETKEPNTGEGETHESGLD